MIHHYGGTSHAVFTTLIKSLLSNNLEPYETKYSFINRIRQLVASIQTIGDKRITVLPIAPPDHHPHPHRLKTRNQCLDSLEMTDAEFHTAFLLVQRYTSSNTMHFMASLNAVTCIELLQISECMITIYDDGEWTVVAYLLSHMKCGEATLPERL